MSSSTHSVASTQSSTLPCQTHTVAHAAHDLAYGQTHAKALVTVTQRCSLHPSLLLYDSVSHSHTQTCMDTLVAGASVMAIGIFICPARTEVHGKCAHSQTPYPQLWAVGIEREGL